MTTPAPARVRGDGTTDGVAAAAEVWRQRSGARSRGDVAYLVYLVIMVVLVFGVPVLWSSAMALARPDVLVHLRAQPAAGIVTGAWLALCAVLVLAGAVRGPAVLTQFFTVTLASSEMPRWRALARPYLRSAFVTTLAAGVLAVLVGATLEAADATDTPAVALLVVAALGAGLLAAAAWLIGEVAPAAVRRLVALLLFGAGVALAWLPAVGMPVLGPGAVYPPHASAPWAIGLLVAGVLASVGAVALLDRVRGAVLREQAARWESATVMATTGDLAAAAGSFRTPPSAGRGLPVVRVPARPGGCSTVRLYLRRDLLSLGRSPERTIVGVLASALAGAALAAAFAVAGPVSWVLVGVGSLALWLASGTVSEGIRHAVATLGAPGLFGQSAERQVLLHAVVPLVLVTVSSGLGGLTVDLASAGQGSAGMLVLPLLLAPLLVVGRVRDAAKGPMPLRLTMPMPTPAGDTSVLPMLAWQADALLLALAAGIALRLALGASPLAIVVVVALAATVFVVGARSRFSALRG